METPPKAGDVCSTCGEPLNADGSCLACLLRGGLEQTTEEKLTPQVYGDFEVARRVDGSLWELGRGAMGVTYRAADRVLHRQVALKVIDVGGRAAQHVDALRERFLREARAAAALRHPNIAGVFQFGAVQESGCCYYAMELVEGETLELRVRRDGPLDTFTALEVARQVCVALVAAAGRGLIHRDLKPGNLMLANGGVGNGSPGELEVKVIDFGLAKAAAIGEADLTHGGFVGTPAFASPEQFARGAVDARSDLYSLGITLWYMLTGKVPFTGRTLEELRDDPARDHLPVEQLTARGVPACVVELLRRVLAVDPNERPASAKELLTMLDVCRQKLTAPKALPPARRRLAVGVLILLWLATTGVIWWRARSPASTEPRPPAPVAPAIPEKSLAVLPFDNFSEDKDSAFFADGVQDEVLTDLAKVADLKVISRTSVMAYKDPAKRSNLRDIAQALGVAYVVEGSVQRAGNKIRVTVQLIDARTDAHKWADRYDRDLQDVFAIQSEIAQDIADELRTNVSPEEKAAIAERPTANLAAFTLYVEAQRIFAWNNPSGAEEPLARKVEILHDAVHLDPDFALAYCALAKTECDFQEDTGSETHLARAKEAAETALRLRPNMGEAHRELARYYYHVGDMDRTRGEVAIARRLLPNDSEVLRIDAGTELHRGHWEEALAIMQKAFVLDPKGGEISYHFIDICRHMHRYRLWEQTLGKVDAIHGFDDELEWNFILRAELECDRGNLAAAQAAIDRVPMDFTPTSEPPFTRYLIALYRRDYDAAEQALAAAVFEHDDPIYFGHPPETWSNGLLARFRGDEPKAQAIFAAARKRLEVDWGNRPKEEHFFVPASRLDAALGRKGEATREARQAVELLPSSRDATDGPDYIWNLAMVYAQTGERDLAIDQLETLVKLPGGPAYGELRYDPRWNPLRGDPRFDAMVASIAPKPGQ